MENKSQRRGLGRGLSALMADVNLTSDRSGPESRGRVDFMVPVERIVPNPNQPRRDFAPDALQDLADSIRQHGIIQPLIVRAIAGTDRYEIVAGERRWRAAQIAQRHEAPVLVRQFSDSEVIEVAIIENIQRADLNAIEEALAYRQLMDRFGHTQEKLSQALSRSRSHIANLLRLLSLPTEVQDMVRRDLLSAGHARALITSPNPAELARAVVHRGLSVRETEKLVKVGLAPKPNRAAGRQDDAKDADTRALEQDLSSNLKMLVRIDHAQGGESGHLTIRYKTLDDLDLLCRVLSLVPRDFGL